MTVHWTQHDFDANNDPKIIKILAKYGFEGYGFYWRIVEMLGAESGHVLNVSDCDSIAYAMRTQCETISEFINDCILFGLFTEINGVFWSDRLSNQLEEADKKSEKARESARKRWNQVKNNTDAMRTQCEGNASKVKQSKVKSNKKKEPRKALDSAFENWFHEDFWNLYRIGCSLHNRRPGSKKQALEQLKQAKKISDLDAEHIVRFLTAWIASDKALLAAGEFAAAWPDAHRWIQREGWLDDMPTVPGVKPKAPKCAGQRCHFEALKDHNNCQYHEALNNGQIKKGVYGFFEYWKKTGSADHPVSLWGKLGGCEADMEKIWIEDRAGGLGS